MRLWSVLVAALVVWGGSAVPADAAAPDGWCAKRVGDGSLASLAAHRERLARDAGARIAASGSLLDFDSGQVAVLFDAGELGLPRSLFDLNGAGLRLTPAGDGWSVARVDAAPLAAGDRLLGLGDDDALALDLPFGFPFLGTVYARVFVSSDGNLTFGRADGDTGGRDLGRLLGGPPRIAPLLADLDPTAGGEIRAGLAGDAVSVSWVGVPQWDRSDANSFQVVLRPDGSIEFNWSQVAATIASGVIGVAPGAGAGSFTALDLSALASSSTAAAFGESFRDEPELDLVATAQRFYASHGDDFDQLVIFTTEPLVSQGTFAFETTVRNRTTGIGFGRSDDGAAFGSPARLQSVVMMDRLGKYPVDPFFPFLGEDSTLAVLAHETGHRWLAGARFRDGAEVSEDLLGRQRAHWSFFMDSDGSYMEGNELEDRGGGLFRTAGSSLRYSPLDLYLMGLSGTASVPPLFYVRGPTGAGDTDPGRNPETGVSFGGERRDVTIEQIVSALGPRNPAPAPATLPWRQAFLFVVRETGPATTDLGKLERIRSNWEPFFAAGTGGQWSVDTRLR